jgi:AcrR family transcriptional regulator
MARSSETTRERIISAASKLFYDQGIRAVSVDAVAEKAGLTKRTLYYHFRSKDDLVAAYLAGRDQPNLALFQRWFAEADGGVPDKVAAIFRNLARAAAHPKWKGCGFLRTSAELANMPGHPAIKIGAAHKKKFEG